MKIRTVTEVMYAATDTDLVNEATAGGTVALWATIPDGRTVCVTSGPHGDPFGPGEDGKILDDSLFVGIYASEEAYTEGEEPTAHRVCKPTRKALTTALRVLMGGPVSRKRGSSYVVGLPVVISIGVGGVVTIEVDLSEAVDEIEKTDPSYMDWYDVETGEPIDAPTEEETQADAAWIAGEIALGRIRYTS